MRPVLIMSLRKTPRIEEEGRQIRIHSRAREALKGERYLKASVGKQSTYAHEHHTLLKLSVWHDVAFPEPKPPWVSSLSAIPGQLAGLHLSSQDSGEFRMTSLGHEDLS